MLQERTGCTVIGWGSHFGARSVYTKQPMHNRRRGQRRQAARAAHARVYRDLQVAWAPSRLRSRSTSSIPRLQTGVVDGFEHDAVHRACEPSCIEVIKSCWLTEHLFRPMVAVIGKRGLDKIPADVRPAFLQAAADATAFQRAQPCEQGKQAIEELKRLASRFIRWRRAEREHVRREMQTQLWAALRHSSTPPTKPLFNAIAARPA